MRAALASFVLFGLGLPVAAQAQAGAEFGAMAEACSALLAEGGFPPVSEETAFFSERGFVSAATSVQASKTTRTYTRSGTPMDPQQILVSRPSTSNGESCTAVDMNGSEAGDLLVSSIQADAAWTAAGESNDQNGRGFLFEREAGDAMVHLSIWGTGAAYPVSIATYQIGTSD